MRVLKLSQRGGQFTVEASTGVRATGATLSNALAKFDTRVILGEQALREIEALFAAIPDMPGPSQFGEGVASA